MSDPRQTQGFNPKRFAASGLSNDRRYLDARQPGVTSEHDARQTLNENVRRLKQPEVPAQLPKTIFAAAPGPLPGNPFPPVTITDRWHKFSDFRITVSKKHRATSDSEPDSDAFDNIADAISFAKTYFPTLATLYPNPIIEIEVHGGFYDEHIVVDVSYLRFRGIGMPVLTRSVFSNANDLDSIVDITADCQKVLFDGFEFLNIARIELTSCWGLRIREGVESGIRHSDIRIKNCDFHGAAQQIYVERWSYLENCNSRAEGNLSSWFIGTPSVIFRIGGTEIIPPVSHPQTKWTEWIGGSISGENTADPMTGFGDPIRWGMAFQIVAQRADLFTWVPNSYTIGTNPEYTDTDNAEPWNEPWQAHTGVRIARADIYGWAENYGWALEYFECSIIGGKFINDTGSGAIHLLTHCRTNVLGDLPDIFAFNWFKRGESDVNYLVNYQDDGNNVAGTALNIIWLRAHMHASPVGPWPAPLGGGSVVFSQFGNAGGVPMVFPVGSFTSKRFWLNAAVILAPGSATSVPRIFMKQGFQNV